MNDQNQNEIAPTPQYIQDILYNVVWDKNVVLPALVCDLQHMSPQALEEFSKSKDKNKVPVMYFCSDESELYGITSLKMIEPFSYETIFKYKKLPKDSANEEQFQAAVTTAYYCNEIAKGDDRLDYLQEEDSGCCVCLSSEISAENGLDAFVYCDKCMLAYHWKCEGFTAVPKNADSDDYKYICKRCKEYLAKHPEPVEKRRGRKRKANNDDYEEEEDEEEEVDDDDDDDDRKSKKKNQKKRKVKGGDDSSEDYE